MILSSPACFSSLPLGEAKRDILPTPTAGSTERASRFKVLRTADANGEPTQEPSASRHGMPYRVVAPDSGKSRFVQLLLA